MRFVSKCRWEYLGHAAGNSLPVVASAIAPSCIFQFRHLSTFSALCRDHAALPPAAAICPCYYSARFGLLFLPPAGGRPSTKKMVGRQVLTFVRNLTF